MPPAHIARVLVPVVRNTFQAWHLLNAEISLRTCNGSKSEARVGLLVGLLPSQGAVSVAVARCGLGHLRFCLSFTSAPMSSVEPHLPEGLEA